ncbi:MAG: DUF1476 domain-containing protein [Pseudomonadota bacterium]
MTTFDERKDSFEKKFVLDEELKFKAEARRNRLLGLWAAEILGKSGDAATAYAREVVEADFAESADADVLHKVSKDLAGKGITEEQIREKMAELLELTVAQIQAGN